MARFIEIKPINPKLGQDQTAKELGYSSSTLQRYRQDIKMLSHYRIPSNKTKKGKKSFQTVNMTPKDLKRLQMTSKDLNWPRNFPLQILKLLNLGKTN